MDEDAHLGLAVDARRVRLLERLGQVVGRALLGLDDDASAGRELFRADGDHVVADLAVRLQARRRSRVLHDVAAGLHESAQMVSERGFELQPMAGALGRLFATSVHALDRRVEPGRELHLLSEHRALVLLQHAMQSLQRGVLIVERQLRRQTPLRSLDAGDQPGQSRVFLVEAELGDDGLHVARQRMVQIAMLRGQLAEEPDQRTILVVQAELAEDRLVLRLNNGVERALQGRDQLVVTRRIEHPKELTVLADELLEHLARGSIALRSPAGARQWQVHHRPW